jgi:hypothetical protein
MADLSDFLGHILQEITRARVSADEEAVRTAKRYAADPDGLLKYFPVPRVRLPNLEITAPMIVTIVPTGHMEKTDPELLSQTVAADLLKMLTEQKIKVTTADIVSVIESDPSLSRGHLSQSSVDTLSAKLGDQMKPRETRTKTPAGKEKSSEDTHAEVVALIRAQIVKTLQALPRSPVGIGIDATTSAVKECNPPAGQGAANVLYVKMSISEEALEIEFEQPSEPGPPGKPTPAPGIKRLTPE